MKLAYVLFPFDAGYRTSPALYIYLPNYLNKREKYARESIPVVAHLQPRLFFFLLAAKIVFRACALVVKIMDVMRHLCARRNCMKSQRKWYA